MKGWEDNTDDRQRQGQHKRQSPNMDRQKHVPTLRAIKSLVYYDWEHECSQRKPEKIHEGIDGKEHRQQTTMDKHKVIYENMRICNAVQWVL